MLSFKNGRFRGKYDTSAAVTLLDVLKWKFRKRAQAPKGESTSIEVKRTSLKNKRNFICWLSHASFLLDLDGRRILIDPVFGNIPFYKRYHPFPYEVKELLPLDYLLLSHMHYDHFDIPSLKVIFKETDIKGVFPLHMSSHVAKYAGRISSTELSWYESFKEHNICLTLVPAKHWSRRRIFDTNRVLWGGYVIEYRGITIYFAGDTAYGEHFKEIGEHFNIDIALLPIGAYAPEDIMKHNHMNPQEAYRAFLDLGAKRMIPMHYGAFKLSDEPMDEPLAWMEKIAKENNDERIACLVPGETFDIAIYSSENTL